MLQEESVGYLMRVFARENPRTGPMNAKQLETAIDQGFVQPDHADWELERIYHTPEYVTFGHQYGGSPTTLTTLAYLLTQQRQPNDSTIGAHISCITNTACLVVHPDIPYDERAASLHVNLRHLTPSDGGLPLRRLNRFFHGEFKFRLRQGSTLRL